jgi:hypothetical protein
VDRFVALAPADDDDQPDCPPPAPPYDDASHPLVAVTLTPAGAARIESEPHLGQILLRHGDGSASLAFRCPPSELDYYTRLFAMLGRDAVVHEPPELRADIFQWGQQIAEHYRER